MRWFDRLAILFSGGKVYLILFLCITMKINRCCVISLAQYISVLVGTINVSNFVITGLLCLGMANSTLLVTLVNPNLIGLLYTILMSLFPRINW